MNDSFIRVGISKIENGFTVSLSLKDPKGTDKWDTVDTEYYAPDLDSALALAKEKSN